MKVRRHSLIFILCISLGFPTHFARASEPTYSGERLTSAEQESAQQFFLTTDGVATDAGSLHIEVQNYKISNLAEIDQAKNEIIKKIDGISGENEFFIGTAQSSDHRTQALETELQLAVNEIKSNTSSENLVEFPTVPVEAVDKSKFKMNYNITLGLVRGVLNGGTVFAGLVIGKGIPMEHGLLIGALAGTISAGIQIKSDFFFSWLKNSVLLVNTAKRLRLIPERQGLEPSRTENVLKEVQMYSKWATLEAGFLLVCQTAMIVLQIPITENLLVTTAKSTASQGVFEMGILKATDQLSAISPEWEKRASVFKNVSLFAGSSLSVLAAIGAMVGMPYSNLGFIALGATGVVFILATKMGLREPVQNLLEKFVRPRVVTAVTELPPRTEARRPTAPRAVLQCRQMILGI